MRWEYKIVHIRSHQWSRAARTDLPEDLNQRFDAWGAEGWELVATESIVRSGLLGAATTSAVVAFFKRPVAEK